MEGSGAVPIALSAERPANNFAGSGDGMVTAAKGFVGTMVTLPHTERTMGTQRAEQIREEAEAMVEVGSRVAGQLADAVPDGPEAALALARSLSNDEVLLGMGFLIRIIQVAAASSRALSEVQEERGIRPAPGAGIAGWH